MRRILVVFAIVCAIIDTGCAGGRAPDVAPSMTYEELTERWAAASLSRVQEVLRANPPDGGDSVLRAEALLALDEPLHLRDAPRMVPVGDFLRSNIDRAIAEMRSEKVTEGATIWKLYNHGWVVRTASHTWAHDLYPGSGDAAMTVEQVDAILDQIDVLFCSHWHGDHIRPAVLERAQAKGIPVLIPPTPGDDVDAWLRERTIATRRPGWHVIAPGSDGEERGIRWHAYPGHQAQLTNNVFAVEADGMVVMHTGDQSNANDWEWIGRVGDERAIDVLLLNPLDRDMPKFIRCVRPRFMIPGHENELGHVPAARKSFGHGYEQLSGVPATWYVLAWGERIHLPPRGEPAIGRE